MILNYNISPVNYSHFCFRSSRSSIHQNASLSLPSGSNNNNNNTASGMSNHNSDRKTSIKNGHQHLKMAEEVRYISDWLTCKEKNGQRKSLCITYNVITYISTHSAYHKKSVQKLSLFAYEITNKTVKTEHVYILF